MTELRPSSIVPRWYRDAWSVAALFTALAGAVVAVATSGMPNVVVVSGLVFLVSVGTGWPWCLELGHPGRLAFQLGLGATGAVLGGWGWVVAAGPGAGLVPVLVLAVSPVALSSWRRLLHRGRTRSSPAGAAEGWERWRADGLADAAAEMRALPLPLLCQFWRESGGQLLTAGQPQSLWLVERRALCLDEIERRRPEELHRWLEGDQRRDLHDYLTNAGEPPRHEGE